MAVKLQVNSYVSKFIELWNLRYDAQLVITCVDGNMGINLQQSLHPCENVSPRYSQDDYHGRKTSTQPHVRRWCEHERHQQHPLPHEQPARRRRRQKRASARVLVSEATAQVAASHHQLPVQPDATSHAPPAADQAAAPYFLPPSSHQQSKFGRIITSLSSHQLNKSLSINISFVPSQLKKLGRLYTLILPSVPSPFITQGTHY